MPDAVTKIAPRPLYSWLASIREHFHKDEQHLVNLHEHMTKHENMNKNVHDALNGFEHEGASDEFKKHFNSIKIMAKTHPILAGYLRQHIHKHLQENKRVSLPQAVQSHGDSHSNHMWQQHPFTIKHNTGSIPGMQRRWSPSRIHYNDAELVIESYNHEKALYKVLTQLDIQVPPQTVKLKLHVNSSIDKELLRRMFNSHHLNNYMTAQIEGASVSMWLRGL